jgi:hypothetical protein
MMRPFCPAERNNAVFRPVNDKGFTLNLGELIRVICPETLPPVFTPQRWICKRHPYASNRELPDVLPLRKSQGRV